MKKKILAAAIAVLTMLVFVSCSDDTDNSKAPEWLSGKVWTETITEADEDGNEETREIIFDADGNFSVIAYEELLIVVDGESVLIPDLDVYDVKVTRTASGNTYTVEVNYSWYNEGMSTISMKFTKVDDTTCYVFANITYQRLGETSGETYKLSGTFKSN